MPVIRTGGVADAAVIGELHARSRRNTYRDLLPPEALDAIDPARQAAGWASRLREQEGTHRLLIAEAEGHAVGFAYVGAGMLCALHIAGPAQGTGVGRALMTTARETLRKMGFGHAELWVVEGNARACRFYERDGWRSSGLTRLDEINGALTSQLQYVRRLSDDRGVEMWHNPSCSKCAMAVEAMDAAQISITLRPYLTATPTEAELIDVLRRLDAQPWDICRIGEPAAVALAGLPHDEPSRSRWIAAMIAAPELIQRPILLLSDGTAIVGRSPEALAEAVRRESP